MLTAGDNLIEGDLTDHFDTLYQAVAHVFRFPLNTFCQDIRRL